MYIFDILLDYVYLINKTLFRVLGVKTFSDTLELVKNIYILFQSQFKKFQTYNLVLQISTYYPVQ